MTSVNIRWYMMGFVIYMQVQNYITTVATYPVDLASYIIHISLGMLVPNSRD